SLAFDAGAAGANLDCWQYGLASIKFRWNLSGSYQQVIPRYVSVSPDGREHAFLETTLGAEKAMFLTFLKGYQWPYDASKVPGSSEIDCLVKQELDRGCRVYLDYRVNPEGFNLSALPDEAKTYLENCGAVGDTPIRRLMEMNEPAIDLYKAHGIDLALERLEIRVCAQHHNGGIAVDRNWQSDVPGLYVCGEAAGTFGRKRPGGSALNSTQVGSMRAARHACSNGRTVQDSAPQDPAAFCHYPHANAAAFQHEMTRVAAFRRSPDGMQALLSQCRDALSQAIPVSGVALCRFTPPEILADLTFHDIVTTQCEVLSAMLAAEAETDTPHGILETRAGVSRRIPQRPADGRDLWFERVWKKARESSVGESHT
ncbi:MAG: hypothetical protein IJT77_12665, partial [Clostridia bacterium]|nr:hypothetical protein [Clostridia bacterium]